VNVNILQGGLPWPANAFTLCHCKCCEFAFSIFPTLSGKSRNLFS